MHGKSGEAPGTASDPDADFVWWHWSAGILIVANVGAKANNCHYSIPPVYGALRNRSIKRMWIVMAVSYVIVTIVYVTFAVCGYYLFGSDSKANVLENFDDKAGAAVAVARLGTAFSMCGAFPLIFKAGINSLEFQFFSEPDTRWNFEENPRIRVIVITVILALLTLISLFLDDIGPVASVEGAATVLLLICAFPIVIYYKVRFGGGSGSKDYGMARQQTEMTSYRQMQDVDNSTNAMSSESARNDRMEKIRLGALFVVGIVMGVAGIAVSIWYSTREII